MQRVSIIGLGLIGTSIGLGLRRWSNNNGKREAVLEVSGFDSALEVQSYAKKMGAVDRTEWNLPNAISRADMIVIATPVGAVPDLLRLIAEEGKQGVVVTDVCSTKVQVLEWAKEMLPSTVHFVGGHPMAGKAQSTEAAEADLFKGATWCVCPTVNAGDEAVQTVLGLISALGAEPLFIDPHEHDGFVGGISHLPYLLSIALMRSVSADPAWRDIRQLTANGFRDVSRLSGGSPEMHRDICNTNRENVVRWTDSAIAELQHLRDLIATGSDETMDTLMKELSDARDAHAQWVTAERGPGEGLVQDTQDELTNLSMGGQMRQLFVGGLFRSKMPGMDRQANGRKSKSRNRPDRE